MRKINETAQLKSVMERKEKIETNFNINSIRMKELNNSLIKRLQQSIIKDKQEEYFNEFDICWINDFAVSGYITPVIKI